MGESQKSLDESAAAESAPQSGQDVAFVMSSMFLPDPSGWCVAQNEVDIAHEALRWQELSINAQWKVLRIVSGRRNPERVREIIGIAASAGEQLGLALTYGLDALRWQQSTDKTDAEKRSAVVSLADVCQNYMVAVAQQLINIAFRVAMLCQPAAELVNAQRKRAEGFAPFSDARDAWPAFTQGDLKFLSEVAEKSGFEKLRGIVEALQTLNDTDVWRRVHELRNAHSHRWRQQSIDGGVSQESQTATLSNEDGSQVFQTTIYAVEGQTPPDAEARLEATRSAMKLLADTMGVVRANLQGIL